MPRKSKTFVQKSSAEVKADVKQQIAMRDSSIMRWKLLEETIFSEDRRRKEFTEKLTECKDIPPTIGKFIRTLKQSVRLTMRHVGGTPFSIIRHMFLHWDGTHRNALNERDLHRCLLSLGVQTTEKERRDIISYYSIHKNSKGVADEALRAGEDMISYQLLLQDIQRGEPSLLQFTPTNFDSEFAEKSRRFAVTGDKFDTFPPTVKLFIEALRVGIGMRLRVDGGTPYSLLRDAFFCSDNNLSGALDMGELIKAMRLLHVNMNKEQAKEVMSYYDRNGKGEFNYQVLLRDVCSGIPTLVEHVEMTGADRDAVSDTIKNNPFLNDKFKPAPSKVLTTFLNNVRASLEFKVAGKGGSIRSWVRDAFMAWDPLFTGKITNWQYVQGAAKKMGLGISEDDAKAIMVSYDRDGNGVMNYHDLMKDILELDPGFLATGKLQGPADRATMYKSTMASMADGFHMKDPNSSLDASGGFGIRPQSAPCVRRKPNLFEPDVPETNSSKLQFTNGGSTNTTGVFAAKAATTVTKMDPAVAEVLSRVKAAADQFSRKTKGSVEPKDVLLGSFLRFDSGGSGRITAVNTKTVLRLLKIKNLEDDDVVALVRWFDTNGSNTLDYHSFVRDMYGDDVAIRRNAAAATSQPQVPSLPIGGGGGVVATSASASEVGPATHGNPLRLGPERTDSCPIIPTLRTQATASTTFDFATKDRYWSTAYEEEAALANKARRSGPFRHRPPKAHRPQSATCLPGGTASLVPNNSGTQTMKNSHSWTIAPNTTLDADGIPETFVDPSGKVLSHDSKAYKQLKRALSYRHLVTERSKVVSKLDSIERQRKALQSEYRARHAAKQEAESGSGAGRGAPGKGQQQQQQSGNRTGGDSRGVGSDGFVSTA